MERICERLLRFIVLLVCSIFPGHAQPTIGAMSRTLRLQSQYGTGTAFSIDVDGREYWITAAHMITGAKGKPYGRFMAKTVDLKLLNPGGNGREWLPFTFSVLQPPEDVDVIVLIPPRPILSDEVGPSPGASSQGLIFGGPCEFMGYALDGGFHGQWANGKRYWMPFVKHCTVSGTDTDSRLWILDGINNPGFSGGPVFIGTGNDLKFVAIISGYYLEPTEVIRGGEAKLALDAPKDMVNSNSGFIIAYDIEYAVTLIKKAPVGPLRLAK